MALYSPNYPHQASSDLCSALMFNASFQACTKIEGLESKARAGFQVFSTPQPANVEPQATALSILVLFHISGTSLSKIFPYST